MVVGLLPCSVDGLPQSLCATKGHFLSRASRLIPNRPLSQSPFYSAHCMGVPEGRYYTLFLDMFPKAYIWFSMIHCTYFKNTEATKCRNDVPISLDNIQSYSMKIVRLCRKINRNAAMLTNSKFASLNSDNYSPL